jgi:hypothetical protein
MASKRAGSLRRLPAGQVLRDLELSSPQRFNEGYMRIR